LKRGEPMRQMCCEEGEEMKIKIPFTKWSIESRTRTPEEMRRIYLMQNAPWQLVLEELEEIKKLLRKEALDEQGED
jgi:hypothetical protein